MPVKPKPWTKGQLEQLLAAHGSWTNVAKHLKTRRTTLYSYLDKFDLGGRTDASMRRLSSEHEWVRDRDRLVGELRKHGSQRGLVRFHGVGEHTVRAEIIRHGITPEEWVPRPADIGVRRHDKYSVLEGDWCVSSDYQAPFYDELFVARMARDASDAGIRNLLIAGDLADLHNFTRHPATSEEVPWSDSRANIERLFQFLCDWFERVVWKPGNHEDRLPKFTAGKIGIRELASMVKATDEGVEIVDNPIIDIHSGGEEWRVIHPKSFSIVPGSVARKLASKHLKHILCAHGHHTSISWDVSGRFRCIDIGGMFDPGRLEYIHRAPSTYPLLNQGFVLLKDGKARLVEP